MKELDFDELDRAVNSLMGGIPKTVEPPKQDDVKVLTIASTLTDDRPPVLPVGQPAEPTIVNESTEPEVAPVSSANRVAAPALRRNGRFMDVIHPSAGTKAASSLGVSRQGVTIAPVGEAEESDVSDDARATPETAFSDTPAVAEETPPLVVEPQTAWPDPLDFAQNDTGSEFINDKADESIESQIVDVEPTTESGEQPEPLSSPFIPDAKVEKRPLGSPAPEFASAETVAPEAATDDEATDETSDAADTQLVAEAPAVELPEELQGDLMAIESDATTSVQEPTVREIPVEPSPAPSPSTPAVVAASAVSAVTAPAVTGPVSIPQQYREEPSTGDVASGSIYDTASYHQPLEHPAKKKSGWLWVIWVLILLIVGAGGGALAYFYLLQ